MSRIGKQLITVPNGVDVKIEGNKITVKGAKGELSFNIDPQISVAQEDNCLKVKRLHDQPHTRSLHGLTRAIVNNMVTGVSQGFKKRLEINGVGYRAQVSGKKITLNLGFSHPVEMMVPEGLIAEMDKEAKNVLEISGIDKQLVGQFAANIRSHRPPEPYKGKGIRYEGEHVIRKAGKTAGKDK